MDRIEPVLKPVSISDLLPTQITVGMREVGERRRRWKEKDRKKGSTYLGTHMVPVVIGPKDRHYIIDHHHLALALQLEGVKEILVSVVADLTKLNAQSFWFTMDTRGWLHPFDDKGRRRTYKELPKSVRSLIDDPFRSLAGELRRVGGFSKETTPFSEFLWADFFRHRIRRKNIEKSFSHALEEALLLAKSSEADYLPGWCGPTGI